MNGRFQTNALVKALEDSDNLIQQLQEILTAHLHPERLDANETIDALLSLLDGPEQRRVQEAARIALATDKTLS
jgi:hypothetical protein